MSNRELLEKVISTGAIGSGGGGILTPKQANRFIDFVVDQSVLMQTGVRTVRMSEPSQDIDKTNIGTRILRKATEAVDDGVNAAPTFSKINMTTTKIRLDWELSTEGLEDNIEGTSLEDHVASLMARQTSNDLEDLLIHGDVTSTDPLLKSLDGYRKRVRTDGVVVDAAGAGLTRATFDRALRNLKSKYLQRRSQLVWYTSSTLVQDYVWSLTVGNDTALGGTGASAPGSTYGDMIVNAGMGGASGGKVGFTGLRPFGIPLFEIPIMEEIESGTYSGAAGNHGVLDLTFPDNRLFGIQRDIQVFREFKPKKDTIEYTQFIRCATQIENAESFVHTKQIKLRSL